MENKVKNPSINLKINWKMCAVWKIHYSNMTIRFYYAHKKMEHFWSKHRNVGITQKDSFIVFFLIKNKKYCRLNTQFLCTKWTNSSKLKCTIRMPKIDIETHVSCSENLRWISSNIFLRILMPKYRRGRQKRFLFRMTLQFCFLINKGISSEIC